MYQVWSNFLNPGQIAMLGIVVTFPSSTIRLPNTLQHDIPQLSGVIISIAEEIMLLQHFIV